MVVLHDAVLHHFFLGQLDEAAYIEEFVYNYGEWNRELARRAVARAARPPAPTSATSSTPCCGASRSARARWWCTIRRRRAMVRQHAPGARVVEIPHLFAPPALPSAADALRFRAAAGHRRRSVPVRRVRLSARIQAAACRCCAAFAAGARASSAHGAAGGRRVRLQRPGTRRRAAARGARRASACPICRSASSGWPPRAVDACINLRYPAAGETSGIAIRLMGIGKPVLVTDGAGVRALSRRRLPPHRAGRRRAASPCAQHMVLLTSIA